MGTNLSPRQSRSAWRFFWARKRRLFAFAPKPDPFAGTSVSIGVRAETLHTREVVGSKPPVPIKVPQVQSWRAGSGSNPPNRIDPNAGCGSARCGRAARSVRRRAARSSTPLDRAGERAGHGGWTDARRCPDAVAVMLGASTPMPQCGASCGVRVHHPPALARSGCERAGQAMRRGTLPVTCSTCSIPR